jgi:ribosomal protein S12 methylthiotransferase accessory factor
MEEVLSSVGILVDRDAEFRIVVADDYLQEQLAATNEECSSEGAPWMLVRPHGRRHWIGPLFVPEKTGCWQCLAWWLTINGWSAVPVIADIPAFTVTTLRLAAIEAAKWMLTGKNQTIEGRIFEFDTGAGETRSHQLLPRAGCPYCGIAEAGTVSLIDTISPLTGVTARVETLQEWPGLSVCTGESSQRVGVDFAGAAYRYTPHTLFGVAETSGDATTVCLAEGIERFSARYQGDEPIVHATLEALGPRCVSPEELLLPSEAVLRDSVTGWVESESLIWGNRRYLPAGHVYLGYDSARFESNTNGCAAGVTLEAATVSALLELVERDAVALWWYNRASRPSVDFEACRSRRIDAAMAAVSHGERQVWLLDLTTDFGVPVCIAVETGDEPGIALGCAAHPNPERCVWKALAGMSAMLARFRTPLPGRRHWLQDAHLDDHPYLRPSGASVPYSSAADSDAPNLADLLNRIEGSGLDVLRVDLTRSELGVPTVRLVAPGLRPAARLLAPGRLYDVPVRLGWVPRELTTDQLNPIPFVV